MTVFSTSQAPDLKELFAAVAKAQAEIKVAVFDKKAAYGPYASFKSVREASIEALSKHGLSILQPVSFDGEAYFLDTVLAHSSGQSIVSRIKLMIDKHNMQGLGSAVTYAKRYAWAAVVGVVSDDDDDGALASAGPPKGPGSREVRPGKAQATKPGPAPAKPAAPKPGPVISRAEPEPPDPVPPDEVPHFPRDAKAAGGGRGVAFSAEELEQMAMKLQTWKFPAGSNTGKSLLDLGYANSKRYLEWVEGNVAKGNPLTKYQEQFVELFKIYTVYARENGLIPPEDLVDQIPF